MFVDGRWSAGNGEEYASVDPSTAQPFATWHLADVAQADAGVAAARAAFAAWSRTEPGERAAVLRRFADLLEKHHEELAQLVTTEVGSPISLARTLQTATPVTNLRWAADVAESGPRGGYRERLPALEGPPRVESELLRVPIGVVAAVTPYNYPVNMIAWKVGPALAAGCTVVLLPSPRGALCSVAFVRLAEEAGVPPGVLNLVPGGPDVGQRLSAHPDVDMVSFTGSNAIGAAVAEAAAPLHTKVVLELGGKSPTVVLPGADLARAVGPSMLRFCRNAGQGCGATTRILVHRSQYDEFVDAAVAFLASGCRSATPATRRPRSVRSSAPSTATGWRDTCGEPSTAARPSSPAAAAPTFPGSTWSRRWSPMSTRPTRSARTSCSPPWRRSWPTTPSTRRSRSPTTAGTGSTPSSGATPRRPGTWRSASRRARSPSTAAVAPGRTSRGPGFKRSGVGSEMGLDGYAEFFTVRHLQWPEE